MARWRRAAEVNAVMLPSPREREDADQDVVAVANAAASTTTSSPAEDAVVVAAVAVLQKVALNRCRDQTGSRFPSVHH